MNPLTTFVRSLGNAGAVANARTVLDARRREDWVVEGLSRRLDGTGPESHAEAPAAATSHVA